MGVLLELEGRLARRRQRLGLDPPPDRVQAAHARVAQPRKDQLAGDARGDHLVVDDVWRHPGEREIALALADDLVSGGERDEVGEALDRHRIAVPDDVRHGVAHRCDLRGHPPASTPLIAPAAAA